MLQLIVHKDLIGLTYPVVADGQAEVSIKGEPTYELIDQYTIGERTFSRYLINLTFINTGTAESEELKVNFTDEEGFPMAVFQSVAARLPIITTKTRASADYLKEPDNCLWVEPKNPGMLVDKITYLIENKDVGKRMAENNKGSSILFTQDVVCKELELIFKTILN